MIFGGDEYGFAYVHGTDIMWRKHTYRFPFVFVCSNMWVQIPIQRYYQPLIAIARVSGGSFFPLANGEEKTVKSIPLS